MQTGYGHAAMGHIASTRTPCSCDSASANPDPAELDCGLRPGEVAHGPHNDERVDSPVPFGSLRQAHREGWAEPMEAFLVEIAPLAGAGREVPESPCGLLAPRRGQDRHLEDVKLHAGHGQGWQG